MFNFEWVKFYQEFATILLKYRNRRPELIQEINDAYRAIGKKLPKMDVDGDIVDLDPFTVFGLFNKGITKKNRILILTEFRTRFGVTSAVPTEFDGIPVLNNLSATFYRFQDERSDDDIDRIWDVYAAAIAYADHGTAENREQFIQAYDAVIDLKGIRWNLSMGFFWIRPNRYLNLDSRNRWYIEKRDGITNLSAGMVHENMSVPDGDVYLSICDAAIAELETGTHEYQTIPEFSYRAWRVSEDVNEELRVSQDDNDGNESAVEEGERTTHYWMYSPGAAASEWDGFYKNGIMAIGWGEIGDLTRYASKDAMKTAMKKQIDSSRQFKNVVHATWQFVHEMQVGDIVYVKKGRNQVIGRGVVASDYYFDEEAEEFCNLRKVNWTNRGQWTHPKHQAAVKTLTDITTYADYVARLEALFPAEPVIVKEVPAYSKSDFLREVFLPEKGFDSLVGLLRNKKNVILQGAPGVGKTFAAKRLAYAMMGEKDDARVELVQFHPNYSYEDFIQGYRPDGEGFQLTDGIFYRFCRKAEQDPEREYFFLIDEINRGNLSKIFGELMMLLEKDYRGTKVTLAYSGKPFSVPENLYLIGMMNTADRSLAMMDYALRRRFGFVTMEPAFASDGFRAYEEELDDSRLVDLVEQVQALNQEILEDRSLGRGFQIGHSYFCGQTQCTEEWLRSVVDYDLLPMLEEYWFDEPDRVARWDKKLHGVFDDE